MTDFRPFYHIDRGRSNDAIIICDHATNSVPAFINKGDLGLPTADMQRHIAYDIGAKGVSEELGKILDTSVLLSSFSRLVIDPNRGEDDPTLVMRLYDGSVIPANRSLTADEKDLRLRRCYLPYHQAISTELEARKEPAIISVHSFTPQLKGKPPRPWHIGVLYADDTRMAHPVLHNLAQHDDICIGDNQPYHGSLPGDTMDRHGIQTGHRHVLIEVRHDLIDTDEGQKIWARRLAPILKNAINAAR